MPPTLEIESTLTDRYQTTVPETVRRFLQLSKRDKIRYIIRDGEVVLTRTSAQNEADPVLGEFLKFLARDMAEHPEHLQAMDASIVQRIQALVADVEVDMGARLLEYDE